MQVMSGARVRMTVAGQARGRTFGTAGRIGGTADAGVFTGAAEAGALTVRGEGRGCGSGASGGGGFRVGRASVADRTGAGSRRKGDTIIGARRHPSDNHRPVAPRPAYRCPDTGAQAVRRG